MSDIIISQELLTEELKKFARTCVFETDRLLKERQPTAEELKLIADKFGESYVKHLVDINHE